MTTWIPHLPTDRYPATVDLLAHDTLPKAWTLAWRRAPEREVLRDPSLGWVTARELRERTEVVARRLRAAGLAPGDRVLLSGGASLDFVVAHCAALRAGLVVVPLNAAYSHREFDVIVDDAQPRAAIIESSELRRSAAERRGESDGDLIAVTAIDVALPDGPAVDLDTSRRDDPALLPYTSGTTGRPKGALLSHGNLLASAEALRLAWRWTSGDCLILCLPLFHMHGLGVGLHGSLLAGASAMLLPQFEPEAALGEAASGRATMFFGVPTMYARLAGATGVDRLGALRLCVSGSAPLSAELHGRIADASGQVVLERYGMTETVMLVSNPYDGERRPGTVGFPLPGVDLRLAPRTSEIEVRGPNVFGGYFRRRDANVEAFTDDGWFRTGDIGEIDGDGYVSIVGRAKELIITGGYNVYPREIEDVLRAHPSVVDAAVVGTPSDEWGETVTAFVEATGDFDRDAVLRWAATQLAPYKRPRVVHQVAALPRNAMGKVVRSELEP